MAIDLTLAKGDLTQTDAVKWQYDKNTPYVPTPLVYQNRIYFMKVNKGSLTCLNAKTGEVLFGPERLKPINFLYASPVAANGHVYITARNGNTMVLKASDQFEVVNVNALDDQIDASLAFFEDGLVLRGRKALYCVAE